MQQGDGVLAHRLVDFLVGPLLLLTQCGWVLKYAAQIGKAVDFLFINLE